ncbi:MFS transporter [Alkaliphilus serpentinus]|uniref:MFS transporter n=1 Tax=Alkaliphilus serpentinus TaxID=1482731 RepID=A0A833HR13_9FIRM|nr:MFS transporter [Alkaliphilus serpentinus]KAB3532475.1 MFS transporter [Alkaliphilus serpentinus]
MDKYLKILKNRDFSLLFGGQFVSEIGTMINFVGLIWMIQNQTGSVFNVSLLLIMLRIPSIFIGPIAGVWVDRWNKKFIIILSDIIRGLLSILLVYLLFIGSYNLLTIYSIVLLQSIFDVFFNPAVRSVVPRLVKEEDLITANSMTASVPEIAMLLGPAIAGILLLNFDIQLIFLINGVSFLISALFEFFIRIPSIEKETEESPSSFMVDLKEGFTYIYKNRLIKYFICFFALASIPFGAVPVLNPALLYSLSYTAETYGYITTIFSAGLILAALGIGGISKKISEITMIVVGILAFGLSYAAFGLFNHIYSMYFFVFLCGAAAAFVNISYGVFLQKIVEPSKLGRVFSIDMAIGNALMLISMLVIGKAADTIGPAILVVGSGAFMALLSLFTLNVRVYKDAKDKQLTTAPAE